MTLPGGIPCIGHRALAVLAQIGVSNTKREPVTLREMAEDMGVTLNAVAKVVRRLLALGLVTRRGQKARTLRVACRYIPWEGK